MPTFEVKVPVGANQIWMRAADSRGRRRSDAPRQAASELGRLDHRRELGQQPRAGHADHPLRSVGATRHRGQADPQGRRLREHQRAVRAAGGARSSRPRRSHARRRPQVHPARGLEGAGQRAAVPARSACASAAIAPPGYLHAKEQLFRTLDDTNPDPRLAAIEAAVMDEANRLTVGPMGFSGNTSLIGCKIGALNRLPASFFVSVAYDCWAFRRLGVRLDAGNRRDHASGCIGRAPRRREPMLSPEACRRRLPAHRPRDSAAGADLRGADPRAQGRRRRADLRPRCSPAATPCTPT